MSSGSEGFEGIPAVAEQGSIGERFAAVAERWPDRLAVDAGSSGLLYGEMAEAAERVAAHLVARGSAVGDRVAFLFDDPLDLLPSVFGALAAGCVYVPLDPSFPSARITGILADAEVSLLLCDPRTHAFAAGVAAAGPAVVDVTELPSAPAGAASLPTVAPDATASLFYTSGSTGRPKGVIQTHRNLIHYARCYADTLEMRPSDRASLLFSYAFSGSIPDIFGTLLCGATLCPFDVRGRGPANLARWLQESEISLLHLVPSLFRHLADHLEPGDPPPALRVVDLGGESVAGSDVETFRRCFGGRGVLVNRLAATEASLISRHRVAADDPVEPGPLPIGTGVEGMQLRVVGPDLAELPPGETGEIEIASRFLSPGYWRRPDLTDAAFRPDPEVPGQRRYRTGDLGRMRLDGAIEHLGRSDQRVKLRGYTVEIAEVEAAIRGDHRIGECAVAAISSPEAGTLLVAWFRPRPGAEITADDLRRRLRERVPDYAVPARWHRVTALPLTPTGKVDRRRLASWDPPPGEEAKEPTPPRTPMERSLLAIWKQELRAESLGVLDDYFALGGTSLQAVQIMGRIEERFGRNLSPSILFDSPTIEALARMLDRDEFPERGSLTVALKPTGNLPPLFCFPGIGGEPIIYREFAAHLAEDRPCIGVQTPGLLGDWRPTHDLAQYVEPQVEAIRERQPHGPYHFTGYSFGSVLAFEAARRLREAGEAVALLALIDGSAPGHPRLRSDVSVLHRTLDRWLGAGLKESQRASPARIVLQTLKLRGRDLECLLREGSGRKLTRVQRRRRHKRAAVRARNRHRPLPADVPLVLIRSTVLDHSGAFDRDPLRGWQELSPYPVEVFEAPGDHEGLLDEPNVAAVAAAVNAGLDRARSGEPTPPLPRPNRAGS